MSAIRGTVAALALLAVAGCSSGSDLGEGPGPGALPTGTPSAVVPTTTLPTPAASTTPPGPAKIGGVTVGKYANDPAVQAYARYVRERFTALQRRDARYAPMLALTTRARQAHDRSIIDGMRANDQIVQGKIRFAIVAAATTGDRSRIRSCERDDASWFVDRQTGERTPVQPRWLSFDVRMVRVDGVWKVDAAYDAKFSCAEAR